MSEVSSLLSRIDAEFDAIKDRVQRLEQFAQLYVQQQRNQPPDDGNYHQQLNERKRTP